MVGQQPVVLSAPRFLLQATATKTTWGFSELAGISMEVEPHEFIFCNPGGGIVHTKQYGKTKPPTVVLKKAMDTDTSLWGWHLSAQAGSPAARLDCTLMAFPAGSPNLGDPDPGSALFLWTLFSAWPSKLDLGSMRAGATDTPLLTVTFACDQIIAASSTKSLTPDPTAGIPAP